MNGSANQVLSDMGRLIISRGSAFEFRRKMGNDFCRYCCRNHGVNFPVQQT